MGKRKLEERIQANENYQAEISNLEKENEQLKSRQEQLMNDRNSSEIDMKSLSSKISEYLKQINILEMKRDEHEAEMGAHKKEMEKLIASQSDGDRQVAESEDLKKKLKLSINNAKRLEDEFSQVDEKLSKANDEKKEIQSQNKKLHKQMEKLKVELDQYSVEAAKASNNPWESGEWEGLTAVEKYQIMKTEVRKLEAKVCFMDKPSDIQTNTKKESIKASSSILAPPKLSSVKEAVKEEAKEASKNTRRRSTRSASSLANYMVAESLTTAEENTNKKRARVETEDNNTKAKVKKTGLPTPVKKTGAGSGALAVVEEREPLGCVTNSPVKTQQNNH